MNQRASLPLAGLKDRQAVAGTHEQIRTSGRYTELEILENNMRIRMLGCLAVAIGLFGLLAGASAQMPGGDDSPAAAQAMRGGIAGGQMIRGTVTAIGSEQVTLKTDAGEVYQVAFSSNTRLMKGRQPVKITEIKAGDGIGAMGVLDAPTKTVHAVAVVVMDAEEVKKAREGMGKIYIVGKVTAIDDVKVTVLRTDGVSQVIEVDEGTSFKRGGRNMAMLMNGGMGGMGMGPGRQGGTGSGGAGPGAAGASAAGAGAAGSGPRGGAGAGPATGPGGESITLADVKIGDTVAGQGALKHGVFVPTELGVLEPGQRRRRPNGEGGAPGTGPTPGPAASPVQ